MTQFNAYLAFYLGKNPEAKLWDNVITIIDGSPFSHVELAIKDPSLPYFDCYSSSPRDGGVRHKQMTLNPSQWRLVPVAIDIDYAMGLFERERGRQYDWLGLATTKLTFLKSSKTKWFCSELCATMCQIPNSGNYGVKRLYDWAITHQPFYQPTTADKGGFLSP